MITTDSARPVASIVRSSSTLEGGGFERTGGDLMLGAAPDAGEPLDCLVLTGEPINEPMVRYGPFVMNTRHELQEALDDFNSGRMGSIPATGNV